MDEGDDEFIWVSREELQNATDEELIDEVVALQRHVRGLQDDVEELRELVYFLLDLRVGLGEEFHPELHSELDSRLGDGASMKGSDGSSEAESGATSESGSGSTSDSESDSTSDTDSESDDGQ